MKKDTHITAQDARRFRMAILRAKLSKLGIAFDPEADEQHLERQLRYAERQAAERAATILPEPEQEHNARALSATPDNKEKG